MSRVQSSRRPRPGYIIAGLAVAIAPSAWDSIAKSPSDLLPAFCMAVAMMLVTYGLLPAVDAVYQTKVLRVAGPAAIGIFMFITVLASVDVAAGRRPILVTSAPTRLGLGVSASVVKALSLDDEKLISKA